MLLHVKPSYSCFGSKSSLLFQNHKEKQTDVSHCRSAKKWTAHNSSVFLELCSRRARQAFLWALLCVGAAVATGASQGPAWSIWDQAQSHAQAPRAPSHYFLWRHYGKGKGTLSTGNLEKYKYFRVKEWFQKHIQGSALETPFSKAALKHDSLGTAESQSGRENPNCFTKPYPYAINIIVKYFWFRSF